AANVSVIATGNITKVYDGNANATIASGNYNVTGAVAGDTFTLGNLSNAVFDSAHVANATNVTVSNMTIASIAGNSSSALSDYNLQASTLVWGASGAANTSATITAANISVVATGNITKVYDGNANATIASGNYNVTGAVAGDTFTLGNLSNAVFDSAHVANATNVTVSNMTIASIAGNSSSALSDYNLLASTLVWGASGAANTSATITAANVSITGTTVANKVYDGNTTASLSNGTITGAITGDTFTLTQAGNFSTANAGANLTVTANNSFVIDSSSSSSVLSDYNLIQPTGLTADITKRAITLSDTQVYSGSTTLTNVTIGNLVGNQTLNISGATANSSHVADNSTNYITNITLSNGTNGGLASNYELPGLNARS
ncbi:MAG: beta strand repeat-containing protein, partial [Fluviibacter sp.]